jgi:hypothetical protein
MVEAYTGTQPRDDDGNGSWEVEPTNTCEASPRHIQQTRRNIAGAEIPYGTQRVDVAGNDKEDRDSASSANC